MVKSAVVTTLSKEEFLATTARAKAVQTIGKRLLSHALVNNMAFNTFCENLVKILRGNFQQVGRCRSNATKRERLWVAFHKLSVEKLPSMWKELYTALTLADIAEQLFDQTVNLVV